MIESIVSMIEIVSVILCFVRKLILFSLLFNCKSGDEKCKGMCCCVWFCVFLCFDLIIFSINILVRVIVVNIEDIRLRVIVIVNFLIGLFLNINNKFIVISVVKFEFIIVVNVLLKFIFIVLVVGWFFLFFLWICLLIKMFVLIVMFMVRIKFVMFGNVRVVLNRVNVLNINVILI